MASEVDESCVHVGSTGSAVAETWGKPSWRRCGLVLNTSASRFRRARMLSSVPARRQRPPESEASVEARRHGSGLVALTIASLSARRNSGLNDSLQNVSPRTSQCRIMHSARQRGTWEPSTSIQLFETGPQGHASVDARHTQRLSWTLYAADRGKPWPSWRAGPRRTVAHPRPKVQ